MGEKREEGVYWLIRKKKIIYPDFNNIIKKCKQKMDEKFESYGNSWKGNYLDSVDWEWWNSRLKGEIKEILDTNHPVEKEREIIDAINILCMMLENNKKFVEWHVADLRMGRHG